MRHDAPDDDAARRRAPGGPITRVIAVLVVAAIAASLILSIPSAFGQEEGASELGIPAPSAASQDEPGSELEQGTQEAIEDALEGSSAEAVGVQVLDPASGAVLWERDAQEPRRPASNQKILTQVSLLHHAGPQSTLATTAVQGEDANSVVLVAGGDTLLAPGAGDPEAVIGRAGIGDLAAAAAQRMAPEADPARPIEVRADTSIFTGPELNPAWADGDVESQEIGPVSPLAFDSHRLPGTEDIDPDPAASVTEAFAAALEEELEAELGADVEVEQKGEADTAADPLRPADQQEGVTELARVESAPLQDQAAVMMTESDNRLAEVLSRVAARSAGHDGSIDGGRQATQEAVAAVLGEEAPGAQELVISDASGMSMDNRVSAQVLGRLLRAAAVDASGRYSPLIRAFPVAGATGTLSERFEDPQEAPGRGVTRAKTGTLNTVTALSGQSIRASGRPAVVVVLLDEVQDTKAGRDAADRVLAAVAVDGAGA